VPPKIVLSASHESICIAVIATALISINPAFAELEKGKGKLQEPTKAQQPTKAQPTKAQPTKAQPSLLHMRKPTPSDKLVGWFLNPNYPIKQHLDFSKESGWKKTGRFGYNLGLFFLGFVTSAAWHEFGHFVMAKCLSVDFAWPASGWDGILMPLWKIPPDTPTNKTIPIALSGFIFDAVSTEIILWVPQIPKDNMFVLGYLVHSIFNNLFYPLTDVIRGGYGDIRTYRQAGGPPAALYVPLMLHSLLAVGRLIFLNKDFQGRFNPWAARASAGVDLVLLRW
jgi:hypothetical protein